MFIQNTFSDSSLTVLLVSLLVFYPIFGRYGFAKGFDFGCGPQ